MVMEPETKNDCWQKLAAIYLKKPNDKNLSWWIPVSYQPARTGDVVHRNGKRNLHC
jgi:hypothetical protein